MKPIILLGEALSPDGKPPFVSSGGLELLKMLDEAGATTLTAIDHEYIRRYWTEGNPELLDCVWQLHPEFIRLNVFNIPLPGGQIEALCGPKTEALRGYPGLGKSQYIRAEYEPHLAQLGESLNHHDPNLVVAFGNTPLWALCGTTGVSKLRGTTRLSTHTVADFKVLSTYHPIAVLRQWELRPVTVIDLMKIPRENQSPELLLPQRQIWIEPNVEDIRRFIKEHIHGCDLLSVDIETAADQVTCIGFAPSHELALVVPFYDGRRKGKNYWDSSHTEALVWHIIKRVLEDPGIPKLFMNGLYDIAFLARSMGVKVRGAVEDIMLMHHALQPESLKSLGFLGSLYANAPAWKHEHKLRIRTNKRDA